MNFEQTNILNAELNATIQFNDVSTIRRIISTNDYFKTWINERHLLPVLFRLHQFTQTNQTYTSGTEYGDAGSVFESVHNLLGPQQNPYDYFGMRITHKGYFNRSNYENRTMAKRIEAELDKNERDDLKNFTDFTDLIKSSKAYTSMNLGNSEPLIIYHPQKKNFISIMLAEYQMNAQELCKFMYLSILLYVTINRQQMDKGSDTEIFFTELLKYTLNEETDRIQEMLQVIREQDKNYRNFLKIKSEEECFAEILENMSKGVKEQRVKDTRTALESYDKAMFEAERKLQIYLTTAAKELGPVIPEDKILEFKTAIKTFDSLINIRFRDRQIFFDMIGPVNIDPEHAKLYLSNSDNNINAYHYLFLFIKGIHEKKFISYFSSTFYTDTDVQTTRRPDEYMMRVRNDRITDAIKKPVTNPHHDGNFTCLGSYRVELMRAYLSNNWPIFLAFATTATGNLNIVDSPVMNNFRENYFRNKDMLERIFVHLPDGTTKTFGQYLKDEGEIK